MNRIVIIELGGAAYEMCYTLWAFEQICEKYGDVKACFDQLDNYVELKDQDALRDSYFWLLDLLVAAARRFRSSSVYHTESTEDLPDHEALKNLICPGDFVELQRKILETINLGNAREVGAAPAKNGDGAGA